MGKHKASFLKKKLIFNSQLNLAFMHSHNSSIRRQFPINNSNVINSPISIPSNLSMPSTPILPSEGSNDNLNISDFGLYSCIPTDNPTNEQNPELGLELVENQQLETHSITSSPYALLYSATTTPFIGALQTLNLSELPAASANNFDNTSSQYLTLENLQIGGQDQYDIVDTPAVTSVCSPEFTPFLSASPEIFSIVASASNSPVPFSSPAAFGSPAPFGSPSLAESIYSPVIHEIIPPNQLVHTPATFFPPLTNNSPANQSQIPFSPVFSPDGISSGPSTVVNTPALPFGQDFSAPYQSSSYFENLNLLSPKENRYSPQKRPFADLESISTQQVYVGMASVSTESKSEASPNVIIPPASVNLTETSALEKISTINETTTIMSTESAASTPASRPIPILPRPQGEGTNNSQGDTISQVVKSEPERKRRKSESGSVDASPETTDNEIGGEGKNYACPRCGRAFGRKFNMQTHLATHDPNRVKPYPCDFPGCGSRFTRKHDLKRHVNGIHKGEKVHECNTCKKPFSRKDAWKRHITTCTGKNN